MDHHSIHIMGFSVGGTFSYYAASQLNDVIARNPIQLNTFWLEFWPALISF